jgi:hypothetical protein
VPAPTDSLRCPVEGCDAKVELTADDGRIGICSNDHLSIHSPDPQQPWGPWIASVPADSFEIA